MSPQSLRHRRWLLALYVAGILIATWQRGVVINDHSTFTIFRQSFVHLANHQNLYASYPAEQGAHPVHRFKYSPSAAMLFAPLSTVPYPLALLFWNALNVGFLIVAITRLLPSARANLALLVLAPEVFVAIQSSSSNALVAALIILAALAYQRGQLMRASFALVTGVSIKIFPLAGFTLALFTRRWRAAALAAACAGIAIAALPLLVVPPAELLQQYQWWGAIQRGDAKDIMFGLSLMRQFRGWWAVAWPSWIVQIIGTIVFLLPLAVRRNRWSDPAFRIEFLCSLLIFVTIFNHMAERQSFVIAATGCAIWFVGSRMTMERVVLVALAIIGVPTVPYLVIWLVIQLELLRGKPTFVLETSVGAEQLPVRRARWWLVPARYRKAS